MNRARARIEKQLGWIILLVLLIGCLVVLRPFVTALLWAVVLCISSWPVYLRLLKLFKDRRTLVALCMTLGMLIILVVPFVIVGTTLADNIDILTKAARRLIEEGPPAPPAWLAKVPLVGANATQYWQSLAQDSAKLWEEAQKLIEPLSKTLLKAGGVLASGLLQIALSIFIAFFLFRGGLSSPQRLVNAVVRIGGEQGKHLLTVAAKTVRGVVYGILGTALIQAVATGVGFLMAGVPAAGLLSLLTFFASVVPVVGTALTWLPAAIWLISKGSTGWGIFLIVWGIAVASIDNFVKPWLISQGSDLPFILIFFGVMGGALAFGFIGIFLGPTLLAVGYRIVGEWGYMNETEPDTPAAANPAPK
jgi:predicted PurR-regulated permease PerM